MTWMFNQTYAKSKPRQWGGNASFCGISLYVKQKGETSWEGGESHEMAKNRFAETL